MKLRVWHPHARAATVKVSGEVDMTTAPRFEEVLTARLDSAVVTMVVDLSEITFLGTAGISVLIRGRLLAQARGVLFQVLAGDSHPATRALLMSGFHSAVPGSSGEPDGTTPGSFQA